VLGGSTCGHGCILVDHLSTVGTAVFRSWVISGTGMLPSVLFLATCLWRRLVVFNTCLAVGFLVFVMVGKFVGCGMVIIGVLSITLSFSSHMHNHVSFATLCFLWAGSGFNKSSILTITSLWECNWLLRSIC
jgi:hypothetical protein